MTARVAEGRFITTPTFILQRVPVLLFLTDKPLPTYRDWWGWVACVAGMSTAFLYPQSARSSIERMPGSQQVRP